VKNVTVVPRETYPEWKAWSRSHCEKCYSRTPWIIPWM